MSSLRGSPLLTWVLPLSLLIFPSFRPLSGGSRLGLVKPGSSSPQPAPPFTPQRIHVTSIEPPDRSVRAIKGLKPLWWSSSPPSVFLNRFTPITPGLGIVTPNYHDSVSLSAISLPRYQSTTQSRCCQGICYAYLRLCRDIPAVNPDKPRHS